jgi:hypothetical protein
MKTSLTRLKNSLIVFSLILSASCFSSPVAQVIELKGQAFSLSETGKTKLLMLNDHLDEKDEVMVEEGASVTLNDYYDATYHLIGGSHIKFFDRSIQLKNGKAWVQGKSEKHQLSLTTANGLVEFNKSEFILTFDQRTSRSQILNVQGEVVFSNILAADFKQSLGLGQFTFIDPKIENGLPRSPTKVGLTSLNSALAEFKGLPEQIKNEKMIQDENPIRSIASIPETKETKKGKILFIQTQRAPASVEADGAFEYFTKLDKNPKKIVSKTHSPKSSDTPIRFYGISPVSSLNEQSNDKIRSPASVPISRKIMTSPKIESTSLTEDEFLESLKKHEREQPKYSKELESLIEDLKSY